MPEVRGEEGVLTFSVISPGRSDTNKHELGVSRSPMIRYREVIQSVEVEVE